MDDQTQRIAGALAGAALGDALGRVPERLLTHARIQRRLGYVTGFVDRHAGATTDDTAMSRLVLEAVLRARGRGTARELAAVMRERLRLRDALDFFLTLGRRGLFVNPYVSVLKLRLGVRPERAGVGNPLVGADELAMSAAPIGCACPADPASAAAMARDMGRAVNFGAAIEGGAAMAAAVAMALGDAVSLGDLAGRVAQAVPSLAGAIGRAVGAGRRPGDYEAFCRRVVAAVGRVYFIHVEEAVPLALAVVDRYGDDAMDAIRRAVNLGRDADTIASMVGAVVGARHGLRALDAELVAVVRRRTGLDFEADARRLAAASTPARAARARERAGA